jgi:hypothetical protein
MIAVDHVRRLVRAIGPCRSITPEKEAARYAAKVLQEAGP